MFILNIPSGEQVTRLHTAAFGRFQSLRILDMLRKMLKTRNLVFTPAEIEEIIKLAWSDTVPFETITLLYGLTENSLRHFMRKYQTAKTYARWQTRLRARSGASSKHARFTKKTSASLRP